MPVNSDLEFITGLVGIRANNNWVVINLIIVLIPLFISSLISHLDVNKRRTKIIRLPTTLRNVNLEERLNSEVKIRVINWSSEAIIVFLIVGSDSFLIKPSRCVALCIS